MTSSGQALAICNDGRVVPVPSGMYVHDLPLTAQVDPEAMALALITSPQPGTALIHAAPGAEYSPVLRRYLSVLRGADASQRDVLVIKPSATFLATADVRALESLSDFHDLALDLPADSPLVDALLRGSRRVVPIDPRGAETTWQQATSLRLLTKLQAALRDSLHDAVDAATGLQPPSVQRATQWAAEAATARDVHLVDPETVREPRTWPGGTPRPSGSALTETAGMLIARYGMASVPGRSPGDVTRPAMPVQAVSRLTRDLPAVEVGTGDLARALLAAPGSAARVHLPESPDQHGVGLVLSGGAADPGLFWWDPLSTDGAVERIDPAAVDDWRVRALADPATTVVPFNAMGEPTTVELLGSVPPPSWPVDLSVYAAPEESMEYADARAGASVGVRGRLGVVPTGLPGGSGAGEGVDESPALRPSQFKGTSGELRRGVFEVRRFELAGRSVTELTVKLSVAGAGAPRVLSALRSALEKFNGNQANVLPSGDLLRLRVDEVPVGDAGSHAQVRLVPRTERMKQYTWHKDAIPEAYLHELLHHVLMADSQVLGDVMGPPAWLQVAGAGSVIDPGSRLMTATLSPVQLWSLSLLAGELNAEGGFDGVTEVAPLPPDAELDAPNLPPTGRGTLDDPLTASYYGVNFRNPFASSSSAPLPPNPMMYPSASNYATTSAMRPSMSGARFSTSAVPRAGSTSPGRASSSSPGRPLRRTSTFAMFDRDLRDVIEANVIQGRHLLSVLDELARRSFIKETGSRRTVTSARNAVAGAVARLQSSGAGILSRRQSTLQSLPDDRSARVDARRPILNALENFAEVTEAQGKRIAKLLDERTVKSYMNKSNGKNRERVEKVLDMVSGGLNMAGSLVLPSGMTFAAPTVDLGLKLAATGAVMAYDSWREHVYLSDHLATEAYLEADGDSLLMAKDLIREQKLGIDLFMKVAGIGGAYVPGWPLISSGLTKVFQGYLDQRVELARRIIDGELVPGNARQRWAHGVNRVWGDVIDEVTEKLKSPELYKQVYDAVRGEVDVLGLANAASDVAVKAALSFVLELIPPRPAEAVNGDTLRLLVVDVVGKLQTGWNLSVPTASTHVDERRLPPTVKGFDSQGNRVVRWREAQSTGDEDYVAVDMNDTLVWGWMPRRSRSFEPDRPDQNSFPDQDQWLLRIPRPGGYVDTTRTIVVGGVTKAPTVAGSWHRPWPNKFFFVFVPADGGGWQWVHGMQPTSKMDSTKANVTNIFEAHPDWLAPFDFKAPQVLSAVFASGEEEYPDLTRFELQQYARSIAMAVLNSTTTPVLHTEGGGNRRLEGAFSNLRLGAGQQPVDPAWQSGIQRAEAVRFKLIPLVNAELQRLAGRFQRANRRVPSAARLFAEPTSRGANYHQSASGLPAARNRDVANRTVLVWMTNVTRRGSNTPSLPGDEGQWPADSAVYAAPEAPVGYADARAGASVGVRGRLGMVPVGLPDGTGAEEGVDESPALRPSELQGVRGELRRGVFEARRFELGGQWTTELTVKLSVTGAGAARVLSALRSALEKFNGNPANVLPSGDRLRLRVDESPVDGADAHVRITPRTEAMKQYAWHPDAIPEAYLHELLHHVLMVDSSTVGDMMGALSLVDVPGQGLTIDPASRLMTATLSPTQLWSLSLLAGELNAAGGYDGVTEVAPLPPGAEADAPDLPPAGRAGAPSSVGRPPLRRQSTFSMAEGEVRDLVQMKVEIGKYLVDVLEGLSEHSFIRENLVVRGQVWAQRVLVESAAKHLQVAASGLSSRRPSLASSAPVSREARAKALGAVASALEDFSKATEAASNRVREVIEKEMISAAVAAEGSESKGRKWVDRAVKFSGAVFGAASQFAIPSGVAAVPAAVDLGTKVVVQGTLAAFSEWQEHLYERSHIPAEAFLSADADPLMLAKKLVEEQKNGIELLMGAAGIGGAYVPGWPLISSALTKVFQGYLDARITLTQEELARTAGTPGPERWRKAMENGWRGLRDEVLAKIKDPGTYAQIIKAIRDEPDVLGLANLGSDVGVNAALGVVVAIFPPRPAEALDGDKLRKIVLDVVSMPEVGWRAPTPTTPGTPVHDQGSMPPHVPMADDHGNPVVDWHPRVDSGREWVAVEFHGSKIWGYIDPTTKVFAPDHPDESTFVAPAQWLNRTPGKGYYRDKSTTVAGLGGKLVPDTIAGEWFQPWPKQFYYLFVRKSDGVWEWAHESSQTSGADSDIYNIRNVFVKHEDWVSQTFHWNTPEVASFDFAAHGETTSSSAWSKRQFARDVARQALNPVNGPVTVHVEGGSNGRGTLREVFAQMGLHNHPDPAVATGLGRARMLRTELIGLVQEEIDRISDAAGTPPDQRPDAASLFAEATSRGNRITATDATGITATGDPDVQNRRAYVWMTTPTSRPPATTTMTTGSAVTTPFPAPAGARWQDNTLVIGDLPGSAEPTVKAFAQLAGGPRVAINATGPDATAKADVLHAAMERFARAGGVKPVVFVWDSAPNALDTVTADWAPATIRRVRDKWEALFGAYGPGESSTADHLETQPNQSLLDAATRLSEPSADRALPPALAGFLNQNSWRERETYLRDHLTEMLGPDVTAALRRPPAAEDPKELAAVRVIMDLVRNNRGAVGMDDARFVPDHDAKLTSVDTEFAMPGPVPATFAFDFLTPITHAVPRKARDLRKVMYDRLFFLFDRGKVTGEQLMTLAEALREGESAAEMGNRTLTLAAANATVFKVVVAVAAMGDDELAVAPSKNKAFTKLVADVINCDVTPIDRSYFVYRLTEYKKLVPPQQADYVEALMYAMSEC